MPDQPLIEILDEMLASTVCSQCDGKGWYAGWVADAKKPDIAIEAQVQCDECYGDNLAHAALAALKVAVEALESAMDAAINDESAAAVVCDKALSTINQLIRSARE